MSTSALIWLNGRWHSHLAFQPTRVVCHKREASGRPVDNMRFHLGIHLFACIPSAFFAQQKEPAACGLFLLAPRVRLELTTLRLTAECSAIELPRNIHGCDGTRTVVRIPSSPKGIRQLPIFTGRCQPAIVGVRELNFCVRDGNRWILSAIATGKL